MPSHTFAPVEALLFDMDGTLVDSHEVVERCWRRWGDSRGVDPAKILAYCHGRQAKSTIKHFAPHLDTEAETKVMLGWELEEKGGTHPISGAAEFLKQLPEGSWAVVTSAAMALAKHRLAQAGLPQPPVLIAAETVERSKPYPDGFLLGAKRLQAAAQRCLVFEDSVIGLEAGLAADMPCLQICASHPPKVAKVPYRALDYRTIRVRQSGTHGSGRPLLEVSLDRLD